VSSTSISTYFRYGMVKGRELGADGRMIEQAKSTAANVTDRENLNK
jgi:hypothetical protein